jgi:ABC-type transporter lipoprotein component MlaA
MQQMMMKTTFLCLVKTTKTQQTLGSIQAEYQFLPQIKLMLPSIFGSLTHREDTTAMAQRMASLALIIRL